MSDMGRALDRKTVETRKTEATTSLFYVADYGGHVCATRTQGREAAEALARISTLREGMIEVNFTECEVATPPFLQELLRECKRLGDRIIYSCLNEDVCSVLTFVENQLRD